MLIFPFLVLSLHSLSTDNWQICSQSKNGVSFFGFPASFRRQTQPHISFTSSLCSDPILPPTDPPSRLTSRKAKLTNAFVPPGPTTTSILRKPGDANKQKTFILQKKPQGAPLCHSIAYILLIKLTSRHPPNPPPPNPSKNLEDFHDSHSCTWPGDPGDPSLVTLVILSRSSGTSTSLSCK